MHSDRYLVDNIDLSIKLDFHEPAFALMSHTQNEKVSIESAVLRVYHVTPADSIKLKHRALMSGSHPQLAKYPMTTVIVKVKQIDNGVRNHLSTELFNGLVPKRVLFGIVENTAYNGDYQKNPFNFQMAHVTDIKMTVDGIETPYGTLSSTAGEDVDLYHMLFDNVCGTYRGRGLNITRDEFKNGYAIYAFDFTGAGNASSGYHQPQYKGVVNLYLKFSQATASVYNIIAYAEFNNSLEIDSLRHAIYDIQG